MSLCPSSPILARIIIIGARASGNQLGVFDRFPEEGMRELGNLPAIVGTFYLTLGTAISSVPLEVALGSISRNMLPITA